MIRLYSISPLTKNVGVILIQNEDLNALQTTGHMNQTLSDMSAYMVM